jgi:hypothetical protein
MAGQRFRLRAESVDAVTLVFDETETRVNAQRREPDVRLRGETGGIFVYTVGIDTTSRACRCANRFRLCENRGGLARVRQSARAIVRRVPFMRSSLAPTYIGLAIWIGATGEPS